MRPSLTGSCAVSSSGVAASGRGSIKLVAELKGPVLACQPGIFALSCLKERS